MRFKTFLSEKSIDTVEGFRTVIHSDCAQYLSNSDGLPLYRGIGKKTEAPTFRPHPKSRDAQASSPWFNFMFNAGIDSAFGIQDIRKNTVFATGEISEAHVYANAGFFFPAGDYKFAWSPEIRDSYVSDNQLAKQVATYINDELSTNLKSMDIIGIFAHLDSITNERTWITGGAKKGTNYIIRDVLAYHRPPLNMHDKALYELLINSVKHVFGRAYNTTDVKEAILSNSEILFYETDGYYHVPITWAMEEHEKVTGQSAEGYEELYKWLIGDL